MSDETMRAIVDRIIDRRKAVGFSFQDLATATGMSKSTLQRYESGAIKNIPLDKLKILAKGLQTTAEYIMGWENTPQIKQRTFTIDEDKLLAMYNQLNGEGQQKLIGNADDLVSSGKYIKNYADQNCS